MAPSREYAMAAMALEPVWPGITAERLQTLRGAEGAAAIGKPERLLTVAQACERLGCSRRTLWLLRREGHIDSQSLINGSRSRKAHVRIAESEIEAYILKGGHKR